MDSADFNGTLLARIARFVEALGIPVGSGAVPTDAFLPGVTIGNGRLTVDEDRIAWPSDLLHEAGHLAVMPADERAGVTGILGGDPALEMAAMAWSYAAARFLGIDSRVLFHDGYKAGGAAMADAFDGGGGPGIPMLALWGMTIEPHVARSRGVEGFPTMIRWLR